MKSTKVHEGIVGALPRGRPCLRPIPTSTILTVLTARGSVSRPVSHAPYRSEQQNLLDCGPVLQPLLKTCIRMSGGPLRNENDQIRGAVVIFRDVTEQMKTEVLRLRSELEMTSSFDGIVGNSPKMQQMQALIKQVAESDITVLIRGESGTGKELVAKLFHFNSPRKEEPFLAINCAALPEGLIESELFGHEKGAFTGAIEQKIGAFERAQGGTILLDEIGDMLPIVQAKLLRVLQEREIQRVGGTTTIPIDVRIIAATNQKAIVRALEATENNIAEAARDLGMGRTTLYRKLKKYDLPSSD